MKYTRYDIKKRKNINLLAFMVVFAVIILSVLLGTILSNVFFKKYSNTKLVNLNNTQQTQSSSSEAADSAATKYVMLQLGEFINKNNAKNFQTSLHSSSINAYCVTDGNNNRVIVGIYKNSDTAAVIKQLTDKNMDKSQKIFEVKPTSLCNKEIIEIINANISVISVLDKDTTKSFKTDDLKKWLSSLKAVETNETNYTVLKELEDHTAKLPAEITRDNIEELYTFMYTELSKLK